MVSLDKVARIRCLRAAGWSVRKIALTVGVSRGTVLNVMHGRHAPVRRQQEGIAVPVVDMDSPPERCPVCGVLVYLPCIACWVRSLSSVRVRPVYGC